MNIKEIPFFSKFNDVEIAKLDISSSINYFDKAEIIYYEGEEPKYLYILLEGSANIYKTNSKGKQLYIHTINAVDFLGEVAIFKKIPYPATAECEKKCKVLKIDYFNLDNDFCEKLFFCQELLESLYNRIMYNRIMILMNVIDDGFLTSKERVIQFILENVDDFYNAKYTDIAKKLNMTPETLSRVLNKLKEAHYISIEENHKITIISKENLIKLSG